jgi:hypothetical protein
MLSLFSKRQVNAGSFLIIAILLIFQVFSSLHPLDLEVWQRSAPLAKLIVQVLGLELLKNPWFDFFSAFVLILFQLILVYNLLNKVKNLEKYSVLATWLYCFLLHLFPAWSKFSPPLIALTILLFILYRIYGAIDDKANHFVFLSSTLIGISFLLWYPSIVLIAFLFLVLFEYNVLNFKRFLIITLSFLLPIIWFVSYFILTGQQMTLLYEFSNFHITSLDFHYLKWYQYASLFVLLTLTLLGLLQAINFSSKTVKMSRLFIKSLFNLIGFSLLGLMLSTNDFSYSLMFFLFPVAVFLALFINIFKRPRVAELLHLTILLCVLVSFVTIYLG